jgi:hypothetical protein
MAENLSVRHLIYNIRGESVILDRDIAALYGVTTGALNQAVRRNQYRFPSDFMFQLTEQVWFSLKSQFVIAKTGRGGTRSLPFAFTEHGVIMLASVLRSNVAAQVSINIARTFAEMRRYVDSTTRLSTELSELRAKIELLENYCDDNMEAVNDLSEDMRKELDTIYDALGALSIKPLPDEPKRTKIGFKRSTE